jgi:hypothetical protein
VPVKGVVEPTGSMVKHVTAPWDVQQLAMKQGGMKTLSTLQRSATGGGGGRGWAGAGRGVGSGSSASRSEGMAGNAFAAAIAQGQRGGMQSAAAASPWAMSQGGDGPGILEGGVGGAGGGGVLGAMGGAASGAASGGGARVGADVGASGGGGRGGAQADAGGIVFSVEQIHRAVRNASHTRTSGHPFSVEIGISNFDQDLRSIKFRLILEQRRGTNGAFVDVSEDLKIEPTRRCSFEPDSDHAQVSE